MSPQHKSIIPILLPAMSVMYTFYKVSPSFVLLVPESGRLTHASVIYSPGTARYDSEDHLRWGVASLRCPAATIQTAISG